MPTVHRDGDIVSGDMFQLIAQKLAEDVKFYQLEIFRNERIEFEVKTFKGWEGGGLLIACLLIEINSYFECIPEYL